MRRRAPCRLPCPPNPSVPRSRQLSPRSHSPDPALRRLCPAPPTTCRVPASFCPAPSPFPLPACRVPPTAPRPTATTSQGQVTSWPGNSPAPTAGCPAAAGARDKAVRRTARGTPPHPARGGRRPSQHCSLSDPNGAAAARHRAPPPSFALQPAQEARLRLAPQIGGHSPRASRPDPRSPACAWCRRPRGNKAAAGREL